MTELCCPGMYLSTVNARFTFWSKHRVHGLVALYTDGIEKFCDVLLLNLSNLLLKLLTIVASVTWYTVKGSNTSEYYQLLEHLLALIFGLSATLCLVKK